MSGEGSLYRRADGRWVAQMSIGGRHSRSLRRRIRPTQAQAREALAELRAESRAGVNPSRASLGSYLEAWVRDVRNLRPATRHAYSNAVTYHLLPTLGDIRLRELTPLHVEHALNRLSEAMSPKSLRNVHAVLRRALAQAVRSGMLSRNVASSEFVDAPRVPTEEPRALSADEVARLLEAAKGDRLEALFVTAVATGLRQGELLGLAWEDLDLSGNSGRLAVRRELVRHGGKYQRAEPKTRRSRRTVPLPTAVVTALVEHRERLIGEGFIPTATGPVFPNLSGGPLNGGWVTHHLYALLDKAGVPRIGFRNLRTTYASRLFEAGVPDRVIADLLGHASTTMTQGHYISTTPANQAVALEAAERLVAHR